MFSKHLFLSCYFSPCSILHVLHTFQKVPNKWIAMKMFIIIVTHWICLIMLLLFKHWSNPYATHLFNRSLNVKWMHCTDGGTTDVITNWCSCFFCSFSSSGLNGCFLHQTVGQLYQILTLNPNHPETPTRSHLSLQKGWADFNNTHWVILVWYDCVDACCPCTEHKSVWQTGHTVALVVQSDLARYWSAWSEPLFQSSFQNSPPKWFNASPSPLPLTEIPT